MSAPTRLILSILLAFGSISGVAAAEEPAKADAAGKPGPRRRAAKHDRARSEQVRGARVHVIDEVLIVGRPQRPLSVLDTSAQAHRFPVGTARYSARDQRFIPPIGSEGW